MQTLGAVLDPLLRHILNSLLAWPNDMLEEMVATRMVSSSASVTTFGNASCPSLSLPLSLSLPDSLLRLKMPYDHMQHGLGPYGPKDF